MKEVTYGVAIAVPEPFATHLSDKRCEFGDDEGRRIPTHVTLVPPTVAVDLAAVRECLASIGANHAQFSMRFEGTGTFRPVSPVAFVEVHEGAGQARDLARDVRGCLGLPDPDFPYHPHVTVAHHLDDAALDHACADLAEFRADVEVEEFVLFRHDGAAWHIDTRFPLA